MLFNKSNNGAAELRELTSSYYKNNDFSKISTQILLEEEAMAQLVGRELMARAEAHYKGDNFNKAEPSDAERLNDQLVLFLRLPIAYRATFRYYQLNLVSHEDSGRKVKMNKENESMPWEWMLDRDDSAQIRVGNETADLLIRWLETNQISEWISSFNRLASRQLFVNTAAIFQDSYPIDLSESFFYTSMPFNKEVQTIRIKKALGNHYKPLLDRWSSLHVESGSASGSGSGVPGIDEEQEEFYSQLLLLVQKVIPLFTMSMAVKRLSIQAMPDGVVQHFRSAIQSRNASQAPLPELIKAHVKNLEEDAGYLLDDIKKLIQSANPDAGIYPLQPENKETNKYFRT